MFRNVHQLAYFPRYPAEVSFSKPIDVEPHVDLVDPCCDGRLDKRSLHTGSEKTRGMCTRDTNLSSTPCEGLAGPCCTRQIHKDNRDPLASSPLQEGIQIRRPALRGNVCSNEALNHLIDSHFCRHRVPRMCHLGSTLEPWLDRSTIASSRQVVKLLCMHAYINSIPCLVASFTAGPEVGPSRAIRCRWEQRPLTGSPSPSWRRSRD